MNNTAQAISVLLMVIRLIQESMESAEDISRMIGEAQEQGRDLTKAEMQHIKEKGDAAIAKWESLSNS